MKIAIVGTRGIPNRYGGFEQFAQHLSLQLVELGHEVVVYTPKNRKDIGKEWNGIKIKKIFCPDFMGGFGQIFYDYFSLKDAIKSNYDVILVCGYVSSYPALYRFKKHSNRMLVHMDGLEWKRTKWNFLVKYAIKQIERKVSAMMPHMVTDHDFIHEYYKKNYQRETYNIPYGCVIDNSVCDLKPEKDFFLSIARNEKENNLALICNAFLEANVDEDLIIFTNKPLKVYHQKIKVWVNEYRDEVLNRYRKQAKAYIHAYTVGGTNPSLIEAMAYSKIILATDNEFHKQILETDAFYFNHISELKNLIQSVSKNERNDIHLNNNRKKVEQFYQWNDIAKRYEDVFKKMLNE